MYRLCSVDKGDLPGRSRYRDRHVAVRRQKFVPSPRCPYRLWGTPNLLFSGYRELLGVNCSGCEANHSPSSGLRMSGGIPLLAISFHSVHGGVICTVVTSSGTQTCSGCKKFMSDFLKIGQVFKMLEGRAHTHTNTQNDSLFPKERKAVIKRIVYRGPPVPFGRFINCTLVPPQISRCQQQPTDSLIQSLFSCSLSAGGNPRYTH
jgi:hypothetical protein